MMSFAVFTVNRPTATNVVNSNVETHFFPRMTLPPGLPQFAGTPTGSYIRQLQHYD